MMSFAKIIRGIRENLQLNQEEFAAKLNTVANLSDGVYSANFNKTNISKWENGRVEPRMDTVRLISETFNVSPNELLGIEDMLDVKLPEPINTVELPYLGTVSAGGFEYANVDHDLIQVPNQYINDTDKYFVLKTNGDSMNKVIANGHYVIVQDIRDGNYTLKNNDILIFKSGSEYTMKRVRKTDTMLHLEPDSYIDEFETQSFEINDCLDIEIIGKVIYSFREFN